MPSDDLPSYARVLRPSYCPATKFEPRALAPLAPVISRLATARAAVKSVEAKLAAIATKMTSAEADLAHTEQKRQRLAVAQDEVRQRDAAAYLDGGKPQTTELDKQVAKLQSEINDAKPADRIVADALTALRRDQGDLRADLKDGKVALGQAQRDYLYLRRQYEFENLRAELHALQGTLARALAIERHVDFNGGSAAERFLDNAPLAFDRDPPFRPDWVNTSPVSRFPGYGAAVEALAAELETVGQEDADA